MEVEVEEKELEVEVEEGEEGGVGGKCIKKK